MKKEIKGPRSQVKIWWIETDVNGDYAAMQGWLDLQSMAVVDPVMLSRTPSLKQSALGLIELSLEDAFIFGRSWRRLVEPPSEAPTPEAKLPSKRTV